MLFPENDEAISLLIALGYNKGYNDALFDYFVDRGLTGALADKFANATSDMWPPSTTVTWNSSLSYDGGTALSNGNRTATLQIYNGSAEVVRANIGKSSGKWYWEVVWDSTSTPALGITDGASNTGELGNTSNYGYRVDGVLQHGGTYDGATASVATDIIGFRLDMDAGTLNVYSNDVLVGGWTGITGTQYPAASDYNSGGGAVVTANFLSTDLVYSIPAGYSALG